MGSGAGDRDLKRKEASAAETESGGDNLKKFETTLVTKPAAAGAGKKRKDELVMVRKPSAAGVRKRKKTRLAQELVDKIMRMPVTTFPVIPDELVAGFSDKCRAAFAMQRAVTEEMMAVDADIIRQYKAKGYAEVEEEVTDSEEKKMDD